MNKLRGGNIEEFIKKNINRKNIKNSDDIEDYYNPDAVTALCYIYELMQRHNDCYIVINEKNTKFSRFYWDFALKREDKYSKKMQELEDLYEGLSEDEYEEKLSEGMKNFKYKITVDANYNMPLPEFFKIINSQKRRFVIVPMYLGSRLTQHHNIIIIDTQLKTLERYEPHGFETGFTDDNEFGDDVDELNETGKQINTILENVCKTYKYSFISPMDLTPELTNDLLKKF
ncbi:hypothetical protein, partial [Clostridium sp.]|uniref:hypothetical protein n=1 Tax=Clostridium sp. TaxID=1506 RepID=UPI00284C88B8